MERKLASIQKIKNIKNIEGADNIQVADVLGWHVVIRKDEMTDGGFIVYFEVDSLLPVKEQYEFLRKSCFNSRLNGFRIKTIKLRGQISQGLAIPVKDVFGKLDMLDLKEDLDVTEILGVRKYEVEIPVTLSGAAKGNFPSFIQKTDEMRIQSIPELLNRYNGIPFVVTEKLDGTSTTYYVKDGEFGFCSRNWEFKPDVDNTYAQIAKKYEIEEKLKKYISLSSVANIAIQGEIIGPSIQKNRYALSEHMFLIYHVFNIDEHKYFHHIALESFCAEAGLLEYVPVLARNFYLDEYTVDSIVEYSIGKSLINKDIQKEGIVIKSALEKKDPDIGRLSFKVINPKYLLKYEE